jgi:hypothetical protein
LKRALLQAIQEGKRIQIWCTKILTSVNYVTIFLLPESTLAIQKKNKKYLTG